MHYDRITLAIYGINRFVVSALLSVHWGHVQTLNTNYSSDQ